MHSVFSHLFVIILRLLVKDIPKNNWKRINPTPFKQNNEKGGFSNETNAA
jgi:hypothetical protein